MSDTEVLDYERQESDATEAETEPEASKQTTVDHHGLQTSQTLEPQEEVKYEVVDEPKFQVTRSIFIGNLRRPLNAMHFQNFLKELAKEAGDYIVERAWLNRTRTHGIVLVDKEEGAKFLREKLLGTIYPSEEDDFKLKEEYEIREQERYEQQKLQYEDEMEKLDTEEAKAALEPPLEPRKYSVERHPLFVDYIPVKAINQWIYEEDRGPRNGKWKIDYETKDDEVVASHSLLSGDFVPRYQRGRDRRGRGRGEGRYRGYRGGDRYGGDRYERDRYRDRYRGGNDYNGHNDYPPPRRGYRGDRYDRDGPRPYNAVPPPRQDSYYPRRGRDRDAYIPGDRVVGSRTDTYEPKYRDRSDSRQRRNRSRSRSRSP
ncbi:predicted protein [Scheffersomyces stipitis CBS 6054]|uniref:RRM domain-containing protein n=1 Tax=Scheffersomyces stipitis (strain ATCC 58785 / CBS 6054 / NBRC 10063 / NRRL Y-11545) TaxID=322104 RepID=A3LQM8_PICST|nr:predicted protein [Scheffersomyces stipitis CBS 6054]ABN65230.2 predicted protein [Scheffersomyces stipitis CBS 6054]